jgi:putative ABC transport system permease protein
MYRNYILTTFRHLFRNKIYSLINIAGLSLGLAAAMLILLFVRDEHSYDQFHDKKALIYRVVRRMFNPDGSTFASDGYSGLLQGPRFTANIPGIRGYVRVVNNYQDIRRSGLAGRGATETRLADIRSQQILRVDSNFLTVFSFPLLQGNPATALSQPHTLVITEDMARREFGTVNAIGRTLEVKTKSPAEPASSFTPYSITGVAKNCPQNSSIKFEALTPIDIASSNFASWSGWTAVFLNTFVVLDPNADPRKVEARMQRVYETEAAPELAAGKVAVEKAGGKMRSDRYLLQPLTAMHLSTDYPPIDGLTDASNPTFSYILSGIAGFVLLIACINFINLTVARSLRRAKEIGIRKVIGSSRGQLIVRFLGESIALCAIAFTLAIVLVEALLPLFNDLAQKSLSLSYLSDTGLIFEYLGLFALTAFAAGFYPALVLSGYDPVKTLYGRFTLGGRNLLQRGLVTLQFALASFLIITTGIIAAQFNYLISKNLGYDDKNLVIIYNWELGAGKFQILANALKQSPDILGVSGRNAGWDNTQANAEPQPASPTRRPPKNQPAAINTTIETIDAAYPALLSIPIVAGRGFSPDRSTDSSNVLVNETFARQAGWKEPIGRKIQVRDHTVSVIGVVKDHYFQPLNVPIKAQIFSLTLGRGIQSLYIRIRPNSATTALPFIQKVFRTGLPLSPYYYSFMDENNRNTYAAEARWKSILGFGAAITIFISVIGLFGLSVFAAEKRLKEVGIRKVLGASVSGLAAMLCGDFLRLVVIALLLAIPLSILAAHQWLAGYPNRISLGPVNFVWPAALVTCIAAFTVGTQAIKAALSNPVKSLRSE